VSAPRRPRPVSHERLHPYHCTVPALYPHPAPLHPTPARFFAPALDIPPRGAVPLLSAPLPPSAPTANRAAQPSPCTAPILPSFVIPPLPPRPRCALCESRRARGPSLPAGNEETSAAWPTDDDIFFHHDVAVLKNEMRRGAPRRGAAGRGGEQRERVRSAGDVLAPVRGGGDEARARRPRGSIRGREKKRRRRGREGGREGAAGAVGDRTNRAPSRRPTPESPGRLTAPSAAAAPPSRHRSPRRPAAPAAGY
jgi:hypothetical protein